MKIQAANIHRADDSADIILGGGLVAIDRTVDNMPTLAVYRGQKRIRQFRGSSLRFSSPLTAEDQNYLAALVNDTKLRLRPST